MKPHLSLVVAIMAVAISGCHSTDMSQAELDAAKRSKAPTQQQMALVGAAMANAGEQQKAKEKEWVAKNPEKVAEVNAARAKRGLGPLGE